MSDNDSPPTGDVRALDQLRREARKLLRMARAGDTVVIGKLRELLPRMASVADTELTSTIRLADVQQAIARKLGYENWATLKRFYQSLDPVHAKAARFLQALRDEDVTRAKALYDETPVIAQYSIHTAAAVGNVEVIRAMLAQDASLSRQRVPGLDVEPLIFAVHDGIKPAIGVNAAAHLDAVRVLLDAGADPNTTAPIPDVSEGIPALYFPCNSGNVAVARLLLERGAHPTDGESVYHAAQHDHRECLALLEENGADLSRGPDKYGNTPLHFLVAHTPTNHATGTALRGMEWLLDHGADPNVRSHAGKADHVQAGETPLHRAAAVGHGENVLRTLVEHGAQVDLAREDGATAYQLAVRAGDTSGAAYLASVSADTSLTPVDQLIGACTSGDEHAARAIRDTHPGLLSTLNASERDALGLALTNGRFDAARVMVSIGWPLTQEGEWGGTPLHWAAWNGYPKMVRLLLDAGAPVNVRDSRYGSSPIAWCAHGSQFCERANDEDYPAIIHMLIDAGATRAESYNQWNESPESMARPSVVAALKACGFAV